MNTDRSSGRGPGTDFFGRTELPPAQRTALRKAVRLEWVTLGYYVAASVLIYLVLGGSQAMKANWVETLLAVLPPAAFLVATRLIRRRPDAEHPYGFHRAVGIAHLVAGAAVVALGGYVFVESGTGLLTGQHPTVGQSEVFGVQLWQGWVMIAVMVLVAPIPFFLGRAKIQLARTLHDKVLYADAAMNKADWMTNLGAALGVAGAGLGLWWVDGAAAVLISADIIHDGYRNLRSAVHDLMDARATTVDGSGPDPLREQITNHLWSLDWVAEAAARVRDDGHVYHIEAFVVPVGDLPPSMGHLEHARVGCLGLDWKIADLVLVPVPHLPEELIEGP